MGLPDWRIRYWDGSSYDSLEGEPHEAPVLGVINIVGYRPNGERYIMFGWDFYRYDIENAQWWGHNQHGVNDRAAWMAALKDYNPFYALKHGRTVESEWFQELQNRAHKDRDFPPDINRRK